MGSSQSKRSHLKPIDSNQIVITFCNDLKYPIKRGQCFLELLYREEKENYQL